ncbi:MULTISPECIES: MT-A70 family methyltransferase [Halocynthiibacter]|uniref:MT-A70 family methyltransferase n=1 Tax=Halocynthiibacter halioticoli TaxID=2986804 RepID=A0AAE3J3L4_9RHOB|nr:MULTISPECIES: MT-A70 family methyltransferase [Halocynthiibacter]MCV6826021.1 MT-A70 family methyltransferase [Halocynthiibacter halioticoli]MCW4059022.1 MT-A70 family methyltransferase [Halocynthiibacter sp. SDUM655004]
MGDSSYSDISEIPLFRYGLIVADPPWTFATRSRKGITRKGASGQYSTMSLEDIKNMPVAEISAPDSVLWLWATNPLLDIAFEVMKAWGFQFKTAGHWSKKTVHGKQAFGTGYILRCAGEPFLIGTIGKPKTAKNVRSVIEGPVREHSRKPDEAFEAASHLCGDVPKIELFSRQPRKGWDVFGNEIHKFA